MNAFQTWLTEVVISKGGPSAIRGAIVGISGWLILKSSILANYGVVSDATAHTTTISWDKLNAALILLLPGILAAITKILSQHVQVVNPTPPVVTPKGV
jgi:hypothetical protein